MRRILTDFNENNNLTAAELDQHIYICINGRGSFKNSPSLKNYIKRRTHTSTLREIILDMKNCTGMDSTFMGVLAGLGGMINPMKNVSFYLINLSDKNEQLLKTLGVSKIITYYSNNNTSSDTLNSSSFKSINQKTDQKTNTKISLEAHKKLIEVNSRNKNEFKSVVELLEKDLKKMNEK